MSAGSRCVSSVDRGGTQGSATLMSIVTSMGGLLGTGMSGIALSAKPEWRRYLGVIT